MGKCSTTLCWPTDPGARQLKRSLPLVLVVSEEELTVSFSLQSPRNLKIPASFLTGMPGSEHRKYQVSSTLHGITSRSEYACPSFPTRFSYVAPHAFEILLENGKFPFYVSFLLSIRPEGMMLSWLSASDTFLSSSR